MTIKNLFDNSKNLAKTSLNEQTSSFESDIYQKEALIDQERYVPQIDFTDFSKFIKFGSAEKYFLDGIAHIYNDYPFDGSKREKTEYHNTSSYLDRYIFEKLYPRFNGYVNFSPGGWGTQITQSDGFGNPLTKEYIFVYGGPNTGSNGYVNANVYDADSLRVSNLRCGGDYGNTVEFWLKKGQPVIASSAKEVVFDLWNSVSASHSVGSSYGRLLIYIDGEAADNTSCFKATYVSGSVSGCTDYVVGTSTISKASILDDSWNHFAFSFKNVGLDLRVQSYCNGVLDDTTTISNAAIQEVAGTLVGGIGALLTSSGMNHVPAMGVGWGKLSGSIDEFRFWKSERSVVDVGRNWFTDVPGGANSKSGNTSLGIYYKFNDSITGVSNIDNKVLDYSGRLSHGAFVGYTTESRNTGSAINDYFGEEIEYKDPTVYSVHPEVVSLVEEQTASGSYYDLNNSACLYHSMPAWIIEDDEAEEKYNLKNLTQIIGQYFDTLYSQISSATNIGDINYSGMSGSNKPYPFVSRMLESYGFETSDLFENASALASLGNRDDKRVFEEKLVDVKNLIYQNIYNNLSYIFKSKGTMGSIRNLVRCFGVDDDLVRLNAYANNTTYTFSNNYRSVSSKRKVIDFNNVDRFGATIYQYSSSNVDSYSFITSSGQFLEESGSAFTAEAEFVFPKKFDSRSDFYFETPFVSCSLWGLHTVESKSASVYDTTWSTNDVANFQVFALRELDDSKSVKFILTGSSGGGVPLLTSSFIPNVYDNNRWTFAVRVKPSQYPLSPVVDGTETSPYTVEFCGFNTVSDVVMNQFSVSGPMSFSAGTKFMSASKRIYVGAHRTNFTGSLLASTDIKALGTKVWLDYLSDDEILFHAKDDTNFGVEQPAGNITLMKESFRGKEIPKIATLALSWDFGMITGSDSSGKFTVDDLSSGSLGNTARHGWLSAASKRQLTGRGEFFPSSDFGLVDVEYVHSAKQKIPETLDHDGMVQVLKSDDDQFYRESNPVSFTFAIEKSMYQVISEEILKWFATCVDFNNLVGDPVNRYRQDYKEMSKIRQLFFEQVENIPDVEKFIEYYKWFDSSVVKMIQQLVPASAEMATQMENVIESHILERNKYWNKFPLTENKKSSFPTGVMSGLGELIINWRKNYHPLNNSQSSNCEYWRLKEPRDGQYLSSSILGVNSSRESIRSVLDRSSGITKCSVEKVKTISGGTDNKVGVESIRSSNFTKDYYFDIESGAFVVCGCNDDSELETKKKIGSGDSLPFGFVSSSVKSGYNAESQDVDVVKLHLDAYVGGEKPIQGPFTEEHVGGYRYRHNAVNSGATDSRREEGFSISKEISGNYRMSGPDVVVSMPNLSRGDLVKRPVNLKNIKEKNYNKTHDYFQTSGRKNHNRAFVISGGFDTVSVPSEYVGGTEEYIKPIRGKNESVFVEKFSAPGGPEVGEPGLDIISGEYSVYNSMNYRNSRIRSINKSLLSRYCGQFGVDSVGGYVFGGTYETSASFHKIPRNTYKVIVSQSSGYVVTEKHDNAYIQHAIPSSDGGYYWITASANNIPYGYATSSVELGFVTASAGGENFCGFASASLDLDKAIDFNAIINNRNGTYGWPSWKQVRGGEAQIARNNKKNNIVEFVNDETVFSYREPPISIKYKALEHKFTMLSGGKMKLQSLYSNRLNSFGNYELEDKLQIENDKPTAHLEIRDICKDADLLNKSGVKSLDYIKYSETIYPAEKYTFLKEIRDRSKFTVDYFKGCRSARVLSATTNSQGFVVSQSMWCLDARSDFQNGVSVTGSTGGEGELQNKYTVFFNTSSFAKVDSDNFEDLNLPGSCVRKVIRFGYHYESLYDGPMGSLKDYNARVCLGAVPLWERVMGAAQGVIPTWSTNCVTYSVWVMPMSSALGANQPTEEWLYCFGTGSQVVYLTTGSAGKPSSTRKVAFSASWGESVSTKQAWVTANDCVHEGQWNHILVSWNRAYSFSAPNFSKACTIYVNGQHQDLYAPTLFSDAWDNQNYSNRLYGVYLGNDFMNSGSHIYPYEGYMSNFSIIPSYDLSDGVFASEAVDRLYNGGHPVSIYRYGSTAYSVVDQFHLYLLGDGHGLVTGSRQASTIGTLDITNPETTWNKYGGRGIHLASSGICGTGSVIKSDAFGTAVGDDSVSALSNLDFSISKENIIFDMGGIYHAYPNRFMNATSSYHFSDGAYDYSIRIPSKVVPNVKSALYPSVLVGDSQRRHANWADNFKVGAMYSRPVVEYDGAPWPRFLVARWGNNNFPWRECHKTGSRIYVGDTEWQVAEQSGKRPMDDSYGDFSEDVRAVSKEYSAIPEFRISEHIDSYLNQNKDFLESNSSYLTLTGGFYETANEDGFYKTLTDGEYLNQIDTVVEDNSDTTGETSITLTCKAVVKFLPYEGFYPAQRTLQLAQLFSQSYGDSVSPRLGGASSTTSSWRAMLEPIFAPGIVYNSIKSGIACDWPIYTEPPETIEDVPAGTGFIDFVGSGFNDASLAWQYSTSSIVFRTLYGSSICATTSSWHTDDLNRAMDLASSSFTFLSTQSGYKVSPLESDDNAKWATCLSSPYNARLPFETLLEPENYMGKKFIYDSEPDAAASLREDPMDYTTNQAAYWNGLGKNNFKLAMHNFLASSVKFFLKEGKMTTFSSKLISNIGGVVVNAAGADKYYGMDVVVYNGKCKSLTDWSIRRSMSQFASGSNDYNSGVTGSDIDEIKGTHTYMYSRDTAFGPPWVFNHKAFTSMENGLSFHYGYEPYTPAYFNGFGVARIVFYPFRGAGSYTLDEIHSHSNVYYYRFPTNRTGTAAVRILSNLMEWNVLSNQDLSLQSYVTCSDRVYVYGES